jgi:hypothetical protein
MSEHAPSTNETPSSSDVLSREDKLAARVNELENQFGAKRNGTELVYHLRDKKLANEALDAFQQEREQLGGADIDKAQEAVDALNFKSTREDHVYAKNALRDAKNAFYDNYLAAHAEQEPIDDPSEKSEPDFDEELSTWEELHARKDVAPEHVAESEMNVGDGIDTSATQDVSAPSPVETNTPVALRPEHTPGTPEFYLLNKDVVKAIQDIIEPMKHAEQNASPSSEQMENNRAEGSEDADGYENERRPSIVERSWESIRTLAKKAKETKKARTESKRSQKEKAAAKHRPEAKRNATTPIDRINKPVDAAHVAKVISINLKARQDPETNVIPFRQKTDNDRKVAA